MDVAASGLVHRVNVDVGPPHGAKLFPSHPRFEGKLGPILQELGACIEIVFLLVSRENEVPLILSGEQFYARHATNDAPPCCQAKCSFQSGKIAINRAPLVVVANHLSRELRDQLFLAKYAVSPAIK
jgi:hypothetical protein